MAEPAERLEAAFRILDEALEMRGSERAVVLARALKAYQEARRPSGAYPAIDSDFGPETSEPDSPPTPSNEEP